MSGFCLSLAGNQCLDAFAQFAQATSQSAKWTGAELLFNRLQHQLAFEFVSQPDMRVNVGHDKSRTCVYSYAVIASRLPGVIITVR